MKNYALPFDGGKGNGVGRSTKGAEEPIGEGERIGAEEAIGAGEPIGAGVVGGGPVTGAGVGMTTELE